MNIGPLEPGEYTADVFHTDAGNPGDTIFDGSTSFIISNSDERSKSGIISEFQSDCYEYTGLNNHPSGDSKDFVVYPSPLRSGSTFHFKAYSPLNGNAVLEILDILGRRIYFKQYKGVKEIYDHWKKEEIFPGGGVYIVRWKTVRGTHSEIITVL